MAYTSQNMNSNVGHWNYLHPPDIYKCLTLVKEPQQITTLCNYPPSYQSVWVLYDLFAGSNAMWMQS